MDEKRAALTSILEPVISEIADAEWGNDLAARLNERFGADSKLFRALQACCDEGIETGWMGLQGEEVRKGARVIEPCPETCGMSCPWLRSPRARARAPRRSRSGSA